MKKTTKKVFIASIIGVCLTVIVIGLVIIVGGVSKLSGQVNDYSATVQKFNGSPKEFGVSETAEFGPYDVTVTSVEKGYTPSSTEDRAIQKKFALYRRDSSSDIQDYSGYTFTNETAQYTLVTLNVKHNEARADYDKLSFSTGSWLEELGDMRLNKMVSLVVTPNPDEYPQEKQMEETAKQDTGLAMTMLYRLPNTATKLTLSTDITLFTKVSALVGTEGMPRQDYQYTIVVRTQ